MLSVINQIDQIDNGNYRKHFVWRLGMVEGESEVTKIKKTVFKQRVEIISCSAINIANDLIKLNLEEMKDSFA